MHKTVLTLDIGTTSLKAAVISSEGKQIDFAQCAFSDPDNRYIALEWIKALEFCINQMKDAVSKADAVSISGNGPTVVTETGDTVLWNFVPSFPIEIHNSKPAPSLFLSKLLALKALYPNEFIKSQSIFSGPEFLIWQLTGNKITILPELRYETAYWSKELLQNNNIDPEKLPPFVKIGECYGTVKTLKQIEGLPVYGSGPDFIAAMIGTGCTSSGALCDCAGSSEGFNLCIPLPYRDERIRLLPSVTPGLWNAAVLLPESGRLLFNYKSKLENETGKVWTYGKLIDYCFDNPLSEGHEILEFLEKKSIHAISILKDIADKCSINFPDHMFVAGGQAKNKRWMTEKEKTLGLKLEVSSIPDAELLGNWKIVE